MNLNLTTKAIFEKRDEKKRTVIAGILQEDVLSANNRFYPAKVVREAVRQLPGKPSVIGHDSNSVEDVIAVIEKAYIRDKVLIGEFRFGTDSKSEMIFRKISENLIGDLSIRASGEVKRGKINNEMVDVVESLEIASVDFVIDGAVSAARVLQVFESSPVITFEDAEEKALQKIKARKYFAEATQKIEETPVREFVQDFLGASLQIENLKEKEIEKHIVRCKEYARRVKWKAQRDNGQDIVIHPSDTWKEEDDILKDGNIDEFMESKNISRETKKNILKSMIGGNGRHKEEAN